MAQAKGEKQIVTFQPYVLRHTALTQLAEAGCDVFTLARIAGHSSITITQRYVHPQADAIDRAFQQTSKAALPAPSCG
jgi:site-specific recombinase XerD